MKSKDRSTLVLLPGFRKCGTTTIYDFLANTGAFNLPNVKEPQTIVSQRGEFDSLRDYTKIFHSNESEYYLDGSTLTMSDIESIVKISELFDYVKIILCLRDPAKRFFSAYNHHSGKSPSRENRSLDEIIGKLENQKGKRTDSVVGLSNYCIQYYGKDYIRSVNEIDMDFLPKDPLYAYKYYEEGIYSVKIKKLKECNLDFTIVYFEDIVRNPTKVISELEVFLNLEFNTKSFEEISNSNKGYDRSNIPVAIQSIGKSISSVLPQKYKDKLKDIVFKSHEKPTQENMLRVEELYTEELKRYYDRNY